MEHLANELSAAIALRETMQSAFLRELPQPRLDVSQGYAACKRINDAHQARLRAATIARDDANVAYEDAKQRFFAAYHRR